MNFNFLLLLAILAFTVLGSKDSESFEQRVLRQVSDDSGDEGEQQVSDQCGSGIEWDNVICHQTSNPTWWQQQRSVVRMTLEKNGKGYVCTAWKVEHAGKSKPPSQRRRWVSNIIRRRRVDRRRRRWINIIRRRRADRRRRRRRRWAEKGKEMEEEEKDAKARRILRDFEEDNAIFENDDDENDDDENDDHENDDDDEFEHKFEETVEQETGDNEKDGEQAVAQLWGRRRRRRRAAVTHNDLYLTAQHCQGTNMRIQFDYRTHTCTGTTTTSTSNSCALKASPVASSNSKDWMLIEVADNCDLSTATPKLKITQDYGAVGDHIYLIGHPGGRPKVISHTEPENQKCHLTADSGSKLDYHCDTQGGMSGCPVFKVKTGSAIAIHTNGGCSGTRRRRGLAFFTRRRANKGTKLSQIVVDAGHFLTFSPSEENENKISSEIAGEEEVSDEDENMSKIIDLDE